MSASLQSHIWNNNIKSISLLALYPVMITGIIWAAGVAVNVVTARNSNIEYAMQGSGNFVYNYLPLIIIGVLGWFVVAYFFHTKMIRGMAHSHPVTREEEPELYNLLENLCISVGMNMPKLEVIESHARNAFASGIDDKSFSVTVTRGLLQSLSKDEVEAVLAHELTHIRNRDVRLLIITIIFTGMVGFAAQMLWSQVRYSLWVPRHRSSEKGGGSAMLILLAIVAVLWIGYFATLFTRFALSRRREYMADAGAVQLTKNPDAMMRALMRISGMDNIPKIPGDITMMCIENRVPFMGIFATHPPIEKRIRALAQTTNSPIPDLPELRSFSKANELSAPRASKEDRFAQPQHRRKNWTTRERFSKRRRANPWQN